MTDDGLDSPGICQGGQGEGTPEGTLQEFSEESWPCLEDHIGAGFNWYIFHYLKFSFLE